MATRRHCLLSYKRAVGEPTPGDEGAGMLPRKSAGGTSARGRTPSGLYRPTQRCLPVYQT